MIKKCAWCGKKFDAKTTWQKYDTDACRQAAFQQERRDLVEKARQIQEDKDKQGGKEASPAAW